MPFYYMQGQGGAIIVEAATPDDALRDREALKRIITGTESTEEFLSIVPIELSGPGDPLANAAPFFDEQTEANFINAFKPSGESVRPPEPEGAIDAGTGLPITGPGVPGFGQRSAAAFRNAAAAEGIGGATFEALVAQLINAEVPLSDVVIPPGIIKIATDASGNPLLDEFGNPYLDPLSLALIEFLGKAAVIRGEDPSVAIERMKLENAFTFEETIAIETVRNSPDYTAEAILARDAQQQKADAELERLRNEGNIGGINAQGDVDFRLLQEQLKYSLNPQQQLAKAAIDASPQVLQQVLDLLGDPAALGAISSSGGLGAVNKLIQSFGPYGALGRAAPGDQIRAIPGAGGGPPMFPGQQASIGQSGELTDIQGTILTPRIPGGSDPGGDYRGQGYAPVALAPPQPPRNPTGIRYQ